MDWRYEVLLTALRVMLYGILPAEVLQTFAISWRRDVYPIRAQEPLVTTVRSSVAL